MRLKVRIIYSQNIIRDYADGAIIGINRGNQMLGAFVPV